VHEQAGPHVWFLILNALEGPFADVRVRQAANYAVNKEAIVNDVLEGTAEVAAGPTPPAFAWAYNDELGALSLRPRPRPRASGRGGDVENPEVTFYVTEGGSGMLDPIAMGTAIQADLEAVGFDVTIETYEWNTFLGEVNPGLEGKADMAEMAWMTNDPDTLPYLALRTAAWPRKEGVQLGLLLQPRGRRAAGRGPHDRHRPGPPRGALPADAGHRAGGRALGLRRQLGAERGDERPGRRLRA
jgi:peptide/nickel transport system substrate-binding protein